MSLKLLSDIVGLLGRRIVLAIHVGPNDDCVWDSIYLNRIRLNRIWLNRNTLNRNRLNRNNLNQSKLEMVRVHSELFNSNG